MSVTGWTALPAVIDVLTASTEAELQAARGRGRSAVDLVERAGALVLADLRLHGWRASVGGALDLAPPSRALGAVAERVRARAVLAAERHQQLASAPVRTFVERMERAGMHHGRLFSIFDLMRDGRELASALSRGAAAGDLSAAVRPYLQVVNENARCDHTGLLLRDVWRYFRHTWSSTYKVQPGRSVQFLVRDAAARCHPVVGLLAISSAPSQIAARDRWIGWSPNSVVDACRAASDDRWVRWVEAALTRGLREVGLDDLLAAGMLEPADVLRGGVAAAARLRGEARRSREEHASFASAVAMKADLESLDLVPWRERMVAPLFRAKRSEALAELLEVRDALCRAPLTTATLRELASTARGAQALRRLARREKAARMGAGIADLTVCGAVEPYRALLGGKLVSMLAISPEARGAWEERYGNKPSIIASSVAGHPVTRSATLAVLTTSALYGRACSQYNRVRLPLDVVGRTGELHYRLLGETEGWGTSQFGDDTVEALGLLVARHRGGQRIDSVFGEGVNPRMRKVREGLGLLGLAADQLLQHGSRRAVYAIELGDTARAWLCGHTEDPGIYDRGVDLVRATGQIVQYWIERWLSPRVCRPETLARVAGHSLARPVRHGARVVLPEADELEDS